MRGVAVAVLLLALAGCGARTPAPASPGEALAPPTGPWVLTLTRDDGTELAVRMEFERAGASGFAAYSRRGAAAEMVGGGRALAGRLLGRMPPRGALMNIQEGEVRVDGDSLLVTGTYTDLMSGTHRLSGSIAGGWLRGVLRAGPEGPVRWTVVGTPHPQPGALRDYPALARRIRAQMEARLYDPALLRERRFSAFLREVDRRMVRALDDTDAMAAFFAASQRIGISHVGLIRNPRIAGQTLEEIYVSQLVPGTAILSFPAPGVAQLRVDAWTGMVPQIARAFERIDSAGAHTLLLDLRWNPGGDISSMAPVSHLMRDTVSAGVFLGPRWYAGRRTPPTAEEMRHLPLLEDESVLGLLDAVETHGAVVGRVPPAQPHFAGEVFLLVSERTASASEPLAHILRSTGRATLVGRRTAGAMLSAPPRGIGEGWVMVVPEADYYTAEGIRLEGSGVPPHVEVRPEEALFAVASRLQERRPLAAALLRAQGSMETQRWAAAEAAFGEAAALDPGSVQAWVGVGRARQEQQRWTEAMDAFERALALEPRSLAALYQLGRSAAVTGERLAPGERALRSYLEVPHDPSLPAHAAAHWRLGMILEAQGRIPEARAAYLRAVELAPGSAEYAAALRRVAG